MTYKFKDPKYQKKHDELCESYKEITGRDFEKDFDEGYHNPLADEEAHKAFEKWKKEYHSGKEEYLVDQLKKIDYRKKKSSKAKPKRKVCKCKK
jgi:hypothetical protein